MDPRRGSERNTYAETLTSLNAGRWLAEVLGQWCRINTVPDDLRKAEFVAIFKKGNPRLFGHVCPISLCKFHVHTLRHDPSRVVAGRSGAS